MSLSLVTAPTAYPLTLAQVKAQCRIPADLSDEDAWLQEVVIPGVTERAQEATNRQLLTATYDLYLDEFTGWSIEIPRPPLVSVTSVKYLNTSGVLTTLTAVTDYVVTAPVGPKCRRGRVAPGYGKCWPSTYDQVNAAVIRFVAGYGSEEGAIPDLIRQAMLIDAATIVMHREDVIAGMSVSPMPKTVDHIYRSFKSHPTTRVAA